MDTQEYLNALERLRLPVAAKRTAAALGMSVRGIQLIAAGDRPVPPPIERLLRMYKRHGLPKEYRE